MHYGKMDRHLAPNLLSWERRHRYRDDRFTAPEITPFAHFLPHSIAVPAQLCFFYCLFFLGCIIELSFTPDLLFFLAKVEDQRHSDGRRKEGGQGVLGGWRWRVGGLQSKYMGTNRNCSLLNNYSSNAPNS